MKCRSLSWCLCAIALTLRVMAEDAAKPPVTELLLPADGRPFVHLETGLRFPQQLGDFRLHSAVRDHDVNLGMALTYLQPLADMKTTVLIFPNPRNMTNEKTVMSITREEHAKLVADILATAPRVGLREKERSPMTETLLPLWQLGNLPMTMQTLDLVPLDDNQVQTQKPKGLNEWTALTAYRDHWVHLTVLCPSERLDANRERMDKIITAMIACIREPAVVREMLKACRAYIDSPLTEEGRKNADALLAYSKESPVFEVPMPGEAFTPMLNMITERSKENALDLLRGFIVGSSVVALQDGTVDQSLQEGARVMIEIRQKLSDQKHDMSSEFLDDLAKAVKNHSAPTLIRETMRSVVPAPAGK